MTGKQFDYRTWALETAAKCLEADISGHFLVADQTPDPAQARAAMSRIVRQLQGEANRNAGRIIVDAAGNCTRCHQPAGHAPELRHRCPEAFREQPFPTMADEIEAPAPSPTTRKQRPLIMFNGRWVAGMRGNANPTAYVGAYSVADVVRLCAELGFHITRSEIQNYWNKGTWGVHMDGIHLERGLWIQHDGQKPKRVTEPRKQ